jgi:hypothetical protein
MPYHSLYMLLGCGIEGEVWKIIVLKARVDVKNPLLLVPFLVPFSKPFSRICNCIRRTCEVWGCWRSVEPSALSPLSASISIDLNGAKNFHVGSSCFDSNWWYVTPLVDSVGFLALLLASSVGFRFLLPYMRNFFLDWGTITVVLVISFWQRFLWGIPFSRVAPLRTLHTGRYTAAFLSEAGCDSSWCPPCVGLLESSSDLRRLTQGYIPVGG